MSVGDFTVGASIFPLRCIFLHAISSGHSAYRHGKSEPCSLLFVLTSYSSLMFVGMSTNLDTRAECSSPLDHGRAPSVFVSLSRSVCHRHLSCPSCPSCLSPCFFFFRWRGPSKIVSNCGCISYESSIDCWLKQRMLLCMPMPMPMPVRPDGCPTASFFFVETGDNPNPISRRVFVTYLF